MTDRELLEAAARAAGMDDGWFYSPALACVTKQAGKVWQFWNPLTDDGDAFRLLVTLGMRDGLGTSLHLADQDDPTVVIHQALTHMTFEVDGDALAATRRAIVRAAAAIGGAK